MNTRSRNLSLHRKLVNTCQACPIVACSENHPNNYSSHIIQPCQLLIAAPPFEVCGHEWSW